MSVRCIRRDAHLKAVERLLKDQPVVVAAMRGGQVPVHYLVGTPKGRLTRLEQSFVGLPWRAVRESVEVKLLAQDGELYILAQSRARIFKERGMRRRRLKKLWRRLHELRGQTYPSPVCPEGYRSCTGRGPAGGFPRGPTPLSSQGAPRLRPPSSGAKR